MPDDQTRPDADDRTDQAKPEQPERQTPSNQASGMPTPAKQTAPGRKPLFGT